MNNQENQTVKQPEAVAPVNDQITQVTAPATDTKPADNTTASTPVAPTVPDTVKVDLSADEAEMVQDLLSNFVYAYRSDREVDCKRELVRRDQVGKYPYVAEAPDPSIVDPTYDWINKKWYSKSNADSLPELAKSVADLNKKSAQYDQTLLANGQQAQVITEQLGNQAQQNKEILQAMGQMQKTMAILAKSIQPTAQTGTTTPEDSTANTDTTNNGGKN